MNEKNCFAYYIIIIFILKFNSLENFVKEKKNFAFLFFYLRIN